MQSNFFTRLLTFVLILGAVPTLAQTPFFTEDFDDQTATLASWTIGGENEGPEEWTWTDNPGWSGGGYPDFAAPTADNGFMYFNSNDNMFQDSDHVVTLTSPIIDCAGRSQVFLEMYTQYLFYFYDKVLFEEANVEVGVSVNSGAFLYRPVLTEVGAVDLFEEAQRVVLALPEAINQSNVQIQIRWTGNFEYFLNVDDIALYEAEPILPNDLAIDGVWIPSAYATPLSQADSIFFLGLANNIGADPQTNVRMRTTVLRFDEDDNTVLEFQDSSEFINMLNPENLDTLAVEAGFLPTEIGTYLGFQTIVADETDDFISNNRDIFEFLITSRTFANDNGRRNWPPLLPADVTGDFWEGGNLYYIKQGEGYVVDSVQFSIFAQEEAHVGQSATISLYKIVEDGDQLLTSDDLEQVGFSNYDFTSDDAIGSMLSAPIYEDGFTPGGVPLEDSTEYIVMVSVPDDVWFFYTYRDITYEIASVIRNGDDLSRFDPKLAMMIRMTIRQATDTPVKEPELADSRINSFPNPARDFYRIDLDLESASPVQLQLMSISGQVILQREYTSLQRDRIDLDVSELAAGAYLVKVRTEEGVKTLKLTKQ